MTLERLKRLWKHLKGVGHGRFTNLDRDTILYVFIYFLILDVFLGNFHLAYIITLLTILYQALWEQWDRNKGITSFLTLGLLVLAIIVI